MTTKAEQNGDSVGMQAWEEEILSKIEQEGQRFRS